MKKKLVIISFILSLSFFVKGQNVFYVIRCEGKISISGKELKPKDRVFEGSVIKFSSINDKLYVVHTSMGSIILQPNESEKKEGEFLTIIKDKYLPQKKTTSTRDAMIFQSIDDFQMYFQGNDYLLTTESTFLIDTTKFKLSDKHFFFIRYEYQNEIINKKLRYLGNEIFLIKEELFEIDEIAVNPTLANKYELYYYDKEKLESYYISDLHFKVVEIPVLMEEIYLIKQLINDTEATESCIFQYLKTAYGNFNKKEIARILKNE